MKLGITCEGGAYRTIFTSGVLDVFLEEGIMADYFIGVSAGIGYGISYPTQQKGRNLNILQTYGTDRRYLSFWNLLNPKNKSIYGIQFAFYDVPHKHILLDYDALEAFKGEIYAVVTNIETGQAEHLPVPRRGKTMDLLLATCAMPVLFPIIEYEGGKYLDGGIADPIPYEKAISDGCDKNIVILTRERDYQKSSEKSLEFAARFYKKYPRFVDALKRRGELYNESRDKLFRMEKNGDVLLLCPDNTKGFKRTERDQQKILGLYNQGIDVARRELDHIRDYLQK
ncbi:patatin family protein [Christensenellaceae bacterium OttesenSCG-928-K19]|nr:patatin family protein [Christensenellaceae bacterium OttesenSCG-928-K19]